MARNFPIRQNKHCRRVPLIAAEVVTGWLILSIIILRQKGVVSFQLAHKKCCTSAFSFSLLDPPHHYNAYQGFNWIGKLPSHEARLQATPSSHPGTSFPLIKKEDMWGNIASMTVVASLAQVFGTRTRLGRLLGPPVSGMFLAFMLGSVGLLAPGGSPGAIVLQGVSLTLATPLILMGADLRDCRRKAGPLMVSFAIATLATLVASFAGFQFCHNMLHQALPFDQDGLKIASALCAKNIGGGINYIAVCQSLQASPQAIAAGLCVDNIAALIYFPITSALAAGRPDTAEGSTFHEPPSPDKKTSSDLKKGGESDNFSVATVSSILAIAATCAWLGELMGSFTGLGSLPSATIVTLLFVLFGPTEVLDGCRPAAEMLGTVLLYMFFATAGAPGVRIASSVRSSFFPLCSFLIFLYSIHGAILFLYHKLAKSRQKRSTGPDDLGSASPQRLLVASSAAIGGPATAIALAKASGWPSLIVPSILVGNIGYALATFLGIAFFNAFRSSG